MRYNAQDGSHFRCIVSFSDHNQPFCFSPKSPVGFFATSTRSTKRGVWRYMFAGHVAYERPQRRPRRHQVRPNMSAPHARYSAVAVIDQKGQSAECSGRHRPRRCCHYSACVQSTQEVLSLQDVHWRFLILFLSLRPIAPGSAVIT